MKPNVLWLGKALHVQLLSTSLTFYFTMLSSTISLQPSCFSSYSLRSPSMLAPLGFALDVLPKAHFPTGFVAGSPHADFHFMVTLQRGLSDHSA
jgi:hypothetical protein